MSNLPAVTNPHSLEDMIRLGQIFRKSGYFKNVNDEAQAVTKILYGIELGFSPVVSMMGIYIVDGKPALSGNLLAALVKRNGKYDYIVKKMTNQECSICFYESGKEIGISDFTMADAKAAGLDTKDPWKKYPKAMLWNRALSAGVRAFCPDVAVSPVYVPEELGAEVNEEGDVISIPDTLSTIAEPITLVPTPPPPKVAPIVPAELPEEESPYIDGKQQSYLARRFREAIKPEKQAEAEEARHAALSALGMTGHFKSKFIDENGNPTSKLILNDEYKEVGIMLMKAAKSL